MHLDDPDAEPEITVAGSYFEGLQLAGFPVEYDSVPAFHCHNTFDDLQEKLGVKERKGYVLSSLITNVRCKAPGVVSEGPHTLSLKQFGLIHIGEVLVTRHSRRVAMLRLEMGCPLESNCSANIAEGDGNMP